MITLFGELQQQEWDQLKVSKPKRYEGIMAERKKAVEAEGIYVLFSLQSR